MVQRPGNSYDAAGHITAQVVRNWVALAAEVLSHHAEMLNGMNVFPVADSDTGSNLAASMRGAAAAVFETPDGASAAELLAIAASGALRTGRGNSGVILSEWLRGFAQEFPETGQLGEILQQAAFSATAAVAKPAPGTILTAAQAAATAAQAAEGVPQSPSGAQGSHSSVIVGSAQPQNPLAAAVAGARQAAQESPANLAALARAGVADAGACGLVLVLGALAAALAGQGDHSEVVLGFDPFDLGTTGTVTPWEEGDDADEDGFEVMFTLRRPAHATEFAPGQLAVELRKELSQVGNSVVVVGGVAIGDPDQDSEWHGHVHVVDLQAALDLIKRWQKVATVASIQVRHLAIPAGELNVWITTSDPSLIAEYARAGAVVLVPSGGPHAVADEVIQAVKASPTTANIVLAEPDEVATISAGLTYPTDLILGPENAAAEALLLMVASDEVSAGNEIAAARETAERLVTVNSDLPSGTEQVKLPQAIQAALSSGLVVAAVPAQEPMLELESAREACEEAGAELVVIQRSDTEPVINWATEREDV